MELVHKGNSFVDELGEVTGKNKKTIDDHYMRYIKVL